MAPQFMLNLFTDYPSVSWKANWRLSSGPGDSQWLITGDTPGTVTAPEAEWTLQILPSTDPGPVRFFSNGLSVSLRKNPDQNQTNAFLVEPGVLIGSNQRLSAPALSASTLQTDGMDIQWVESAHQTTLLLHKEGSFSLVTGEFTKEQALLKAEDALEEDFDRLCEQESTRRTRTNDLFSVNPRHNPPVALAAETLMRRLRSRTASIHGLWSAAEGFEDESFSLNELYALVHAWVLIDPPVAMELARTALSLQQPTGGFPAWMTREGILSPAASWPLIAQVFELAWQKGDHDPVLLKQTLPALRKYIQWALRRFDPHRDGIPAWQSEQEIFIPESFERGKATPDLTVMLLGEIEALLRLCEESDHSEAAIESLTEQRDQLARTLTTIFWNPEKKSFSNVWKDGHFKTEPSFGSFLPLLWENLPSDHQTPLLETFEETHGFPGREEPETWKKEQIDDTAHLPAIHQFMAFESLRQADTGRALLMLFVRRAREGFAAWFERESIEAARLVSHGETSDQPAYNLGPLTASLILTTQVEFQRDASQRAPIIKHLILGVHRLRLTRTDLRIMIIFGLAILLVHLAYDLGQTQSSEISMAEAAAYYRQGQFTEAMGICRRHPDAPLSRLLRANLLMLAGKPEEAEELYHRALRQETGSPSALFGYALALQMNGKHKQAIRRYNDFIDIYEPQLSVKGREDLVDLAYEFLRLADEKFSKPPRWKRVYSHAIMNDLGL